MLYEGRHAGMNTFAMTLYSAAQQTDYAQVIQFVGQDASGSFGVLAGAEDLLTMLPFGMVRFQTADLLWHYLAVPEAVLHFTANRMHVTASSFIVGDDRNRMTQLLDSTRHEQTQRVHSTRLSVQQLDQALMRKFLQTGRESI